MLKEPNVGTETVGPALARFILRSGVVAFDRMTV